MRAFVAIGFPAELRSRAWEAVRPLREADFPFRWVGAERLHVTLRFLGDVPGGLVEQTSAAVRAAARACGPIRVGLGGIGAFPSLRRPRVVWMGLDVPGELATLQEAVEERLAALGFEREGRAFHPHLTLGRAHRDARAARFRGLEEAAAQVSFRAAHEVSSVELMRSELRRSGAQYSIVASHPLADRPGEVG